VTGSESAAAVVDGGARRRKYRQAAVFYFGYGVLYVAGVLGLARRTGWWLHGLRPIWTFVFLPLGAAIAVVFAILVARQIRWFTRLLAVLVLGRAAFLFMEIHVQPVMVGPALVAAATAWMLARAGWDL
jgi:hypothetical protein